MLISIWKNLKSTFNFNWAGSDLPKGNLPTHDLPTHNLPMTICRLMICQIGKLHKKLMICRLGTTPASRPGVARRLLRLQTFARPSLQYCLSVIVGNVVKTMLASFKLRFGKSCFNVFLLYKNWKSAKKVVSFGK